ncbi:hypothetical protein TNCV_865061 [Trichonephila clavipes]|nr:hypothetical protein TNCV_865061 [Trichonephila clavipes]
MSATIPAQISRKRIFFYQTWRRRLKGAKKRLWDNNLEFIALIMNKFGLLEYIEIKYRGKGPETCGDFYFQQDNDTEQKAYIVGSHSCSKPILQAILVPRTKRNRAFVEFTLEQRFSNCGAR